MYYHNLCKYYLYNEITNLLLEKLFTDACRIYRPTPTMGSTVNTNCTAQQ